MPQLRAALNAFQQRLDRSEFQEAYADLEQLEDTYAPLLAEAHTEKQRYHYLKARLLSRRGDHSMAQSHLASALQLSEQFPDSVRLVARSYWTAREVYERAQRYTDALVYAQRLADLYGLFPTKDPIDLARNYHKIGQLHLALQQPAPALRQLQTAQTIYNQTSQTTPLDLTTLDRSFGAAYAAQRQYERQALHLRQAIERCRAFPSLQQHLVYTTLLKDLGDYYLGQGQASDGLATYLAYAKTAVDQEGEHSILSGVAHTDMAVAYARMGNLQEAERYFERAVAIKRAVYGARHPQIAVTYGNLALLLQQRKAYRSAVAATYKSLVANLAGETDVDPRTSILELVQSRQLVQPLLGIQNLQIRARSYWAWYQQKGDLQLLIDTYESIAAQVVAFDQAKNLLTDVEKLRLLTPDFMPFNRGVEVAYLLYEQTQQRPYLEAAFEWAERAKDAALVRTLSTETSLSYGGIPDSLQAREQQLRQGLTVLDRRLLDLPGGNYLYPELERQALALRQEYQALVSKIEREYPRYYELAYTSRVATLSQLQQEVLDDKSGLLAYYIPYPEAYLWYATPDAVRCVRLTLDSSYQRAVERFRTCLTTPQDEFAEERHQLARYFGERFVTSLLAGTAPERLMVLPDHGLSHLPFETFEVTQPSSGPTQQPYLLFRYAFSYAYSGSLLLQAKRLQDARPTNNTRLLAIAPDYGLLLNEERKAQRSTHDWLLRQQLPQLPQARDEVQGLENEFMGTYWYGSNATEAHFKVQAPDYGLLHLALHTLVNQRQPAYSALAFVEDKAVQEDNFLTAAEISHLDLSAQLVVLSHCQTGYGRFERGEGLAALTRSFIYAGVPSAVVNLWPANASSAAPIMASYHRYLREGLPKSVALQRAKLDYLEAVPIGVQAPFYWAAWVQRGYDEPLDQFTNSIFSPSSLFLIFFSLCLLLILVVALRRRRRANQLVDGWE